VIHRVVVPGPPGPRSPLFTTGFAPDREPTIRTGVAALTLSVLELMGKPR
jgi:hypothetical protein